MSLLGNLTIGIIGNMGGLTDSFSQAQNQARQFGRSMENIGGSLSSAGSSITQTFGAAFTAITGGLFLAGKEAADFEAQMSSVKSVMAPDEIKKYSGALEELATKMGNETKYSAVEAAQGIEELIKAGVSLEDIIKGGLDGALSLAVAGELDLASAAEIASTALNAFKDDNLTVTRAADLLAGAANASATAVGEMKYGLSMVSAVASGVGLSFEDTTTALAAFAQNGLLGSDAGTSLKTMLLNLSPSTKAASEQMAELGLLTEKGTSAFYDADESIKSLAEIAELLKTKLAGLTDEQRQMALKTMFGTDAIRAANILYREGAEGIEVMNEAMNKITAADVAAVKLDNLKGKITILLGTIKTAAKSIGDPLLDMAGSVVDAFQGIINWFNKLSPSTLEMVAKIGLAASAITGLATGFGVILMVVGGVISSIGTITTAFVSLSGAIANAGGIIGILTGPIGIAVAAIVALGAALIALWNQSETFRTSVIEIFNSFKDIAVSVFETVATFIGEKIIQIKGFWDANGPAFLEAVENVFNGIKAVIEFVMPAIKFIIEMVWTAIKQVISGALDVIMGLIKVFSGLFTGDFSKMWEGIKDIFKGAIDFVIGLMTLTFVGGLRTLLTNLAKLGVNLVKGMADGIVGLFKSFTTTGQNLAKGFVDAVVGFFRNFVDAVITLFNLFKARGESTFNAFSGVVKSIFTSLGNGLKSIWNGISGLFTNTATTIKNVVSGIFEALKSTISTIWGGVKTVISKIWDGVMNFFKNIDLRDIGKDIIKGLVNGIGSMASAVWNKAKEIANGIGDSIKKTLDINSPSKVTTELGEYVGQGLAKGIDNSNKQVSKATTDLSSAVDKQFTQTMNQIVQQADNAAAGTKKSTDKIKRSFNEAFAAVQHQYKTGTFNTAQYVDALKMVSSNYAKTSEQQRKIASEMLKVEKSLVEEKKKLDKDSFEHSKSYIEAKRQANEMSLAAELTAWERVHQRYAQGSEERIEAEKNIQRVRQEIYDQLLQANDEFLKKTQEINKNVEDEETRLNEVYEKAVEERTKSIRDFAGLFDEVVFKAEKTGEDLLSNLRGQVSYIEEWSTTIEQLAQRGIDKGLLEELRNMGPKAMPELMALNSLTDTQLREYELLWKQKTEQARKIAVEELKGMRTDTDTQISELHKRAAVQLEGVKKEFETKVKSIRQGTEQEFNAMKSTMPQIGKQAMEGLRNGLNSMKGPLMSTARDIADDIASTIRRALDVRSPSRVMKEIGVYVGMGLQAGIADMILDVKNTSAKLAKAAIIDVPDVNLGGVRGNRNSSSSSTVSSMMSGITQNITINSPTALTPSETARKNLQAARQLALEWR